jgi:hypothetical protein
MVGWACTGSAMAEFLYALTHDERAAFRAVGRVRRFAKGEAIFHEGDDAGGVVAVVSGTVKVSLIGVAGRLVELAQTAAADPPPHHPSQMASSAACRIGSR